MTTTNSFRPKRPKRTAYEKLVHLNQCTRHTWARLELKKVRRNFGPIPWAQRQLFRQLDARILAHGGRTGAGITRPRKRRAGDPPYSDAADAAERRWL